MSFFGTYFALPATYGAISSGMITFKGMLQTFDFAFLFFLAQPIPHTASLHGMTDNCKISTPINIAGKTRIPDSFFFIFLGFSGGWFRANRVTAPVTTLNCVMLFP